MSQDEPTDRSPQRQALCALLDGDAADADLACSIWREDPLSRADWHAYNLIAELMRSDDVRCAPQHDAQFLCRLRERLAMEPVVLAPADAMRQASWRRAWVVPTAVAAGFVAVAGVLMVAGLAVPDESLRQRSATLASSATDQGGLDRQAVAIAPPASAALAPVGSGVLIRSAELDRYLSAHKQHSNTSALAVPGGAVRNAATAAPGR